MQDILNFDKKRELDNSNNTELSLLNYVKDGVIIVGLDGDIVYANNFGKAIIDNGLIAPADIISKNNKNIEYDGCEYSIEYDDITENMGKDGVIAIFSAICNRKDSFSEIEALKKELEKASAFKAAFLANMSHEIRTPIHAIIGFSEIIKKQPVDDLVQKQIEMIENSSYSLLAIINDVLDLSKIESGKLELIKSNYYISYIIRDIEAAFSMMCTRKGLAFNMHLDSNIPSYLNGDKIRLRGALLNILNNAVKFTKKGQIDFSIKVKSLENDSATLCFEIKDTGVGIKKDDLNKIFESFSKFEISNDSSVEGRGLGLSIAKSYIELMGGKIEVESEFGVGSTFRIIVDQKVIDSSPVDMKIVNARKNTKDKESIKIENCRALVVDDNSTNLIVADGLMRAYGLTVEKASGGQEAIDKCKSNKYDIIFMDQMMPEVDGIMAMKEIRKLDDYYAKEAVIIVLTADAMAGVRDRLLDEGFNEYISKPIEIHRLETILKQFIPENKIHIKKPEDSNIKINEETLKYVKDKIRKAEDALNSNDFDRFSTQIRSIRGVVTNLGNFILAEDIKSLEQDIKNEKYGFILKPAKEIINDCRLFMNIE